MKFSHLKLHGFKSFCDAADLYLEPGLTGVVGPNGCGKSNLVEALRWVMGESSYKAMRAAGMDEVIFSGSGNRPSRNTAEVTLVLDNSDRTAPAHLNNADVLEVTRRIEREAGSIYRINGREVRARDVQLLFADASTGAHSPALVRQGQIGELIAAKPQQRRALLEEAAGISGLHSRRHEAELRLRGAEQNLERVDDIIAQVEAQLDNLKKQARLAIRYRNISGDIRKTEATLFHLRWVAARVGEREAEAQQGRLISQMATAATAESAANKTREDADAKLEPLRMAEAAAGAARQKLVLMRTQLDEERARLNARRTELEDRATQIAADTSRDEALIAESGEQLLALAEEKAALLAEQAAEAGGEARAKAETETTSAALTEKERGAHEAETRLAQLQAAHAQHTLALNSANQRLERLRGERDTAAKSLAETTKAMASNAEVAAAQTALDAAREKSETAEKSASDAEAAASKRQAALDAARPALATSEAALSRLESEAATLSRVLNVTAGDLWPPVADSLQVKPGYETALGAALGADLDASGDTGAPLHWREPGSENNDASLPEGARPLTEFVKGPTFLTRRLNQIGIVSDQDGPTLMKALRPGQRLVSVSGNLWRWDGLVAAADAPGAAAQRLSQRNRLADLDAEISGAKIARNDNASQITTLTADLATARESERAARQDARTSQNAVAEAHTSLDRAQKSVSDLSRRQSALEEAINRLATDIADTTTRATDAGKALAALGATQEAEAEVAAIQAALAPLRLAAAEAQAKQATLGHATTARQSRLARLETDEQGYTRRKADAETHRAALSERAELIKTEAEALSETPGALEARQKELDDEIATADQKLRLAGDALGTGQSGLRAADQAARAATQALAEVRENLARTEERLKGQAAQRHQIERAVVEALDITADRTAEVAGIRPEQALPEEEPVERKLERLKAERERLGGVNLAAEREATEIEEKLTAMVTDREDLIAAIAKLRTGISTLNREGRSRLTEAFEKVNGHFRELFTSLFGGGTAELTFVESDDPLEAGLEIIARPPGKKPQSMTLLSGGEQALTALSLIFAVFLTNPAPICVLDEVDAPLDDANVERFCTLLDTMCARTDTRFMVITHNPITMSRVDRLFGVTMAERGVSQLVSVDLTVAQAFRETA